MVRFKVALLWISFNSDKTELENDMDFELFKCYKLIK